MTTLIDMVDRFQTLLWSGKIDVAASMLSEDFTWENMPWPDKRLKGRRIFSEVQQKFHDLVESGYHRNLNAIAGGNQVMVERYEEFVIKGYTLRLNVVGIFRIDEGRITFWRDYYDQATYDRQMTEAGVLEISNEQLNNVGLG